MKRSAFIYYSLIGTAAVVVPSLRCSNNHNYLQVLRQPKFLSHICDAATLLYIGKGYLENFPLYNKEQLVNKLMKENGGKTISKNTGSSLITSLLDKKIKADFESGRTAVIKGWILAETEAQQCALFSLS